MKKFIFTFALVAMIGAFASCCKTANCDSSADTTLTDTIDTVLVDTVVAQ